MCTGLEPATIGMLASGLGAGAQLLNSQQAAKRQDRELARGMDARARLTEEAGQRVQKQISDVATSNPDAERQERNNAFMAALRQAKVADGGADFAGTPGASDRFTADVGQARAGALQEGRTLSGQLAAIDAPVLQRQREARGFTDAVTDVGLIADRGAGNDFLTELRAARAGQTNPWVDALSSGLQTFGPAYAGRARTPGKKVAGSAGRVRKGVY